MLNSIIESKAVEAVAVKAEDRKYIDSQTANFIRGTFFQLANDLQMATMMNMGDQTATSICERYTIQNDRLSMDLVIKGSKPTGMWTSSILSCDTYPHFNANLERLIADLPDEDTLAVVSQLQKLMQLFRQGHHFDSDADEKFFNIRFESRPQKFFAELTINVL